LTITSLDSAPRVSPNSERKVNQQKTNRPGGWYLREADAAEAEKWRTDNAPVGSDCTTKIDRDYKFEFIAICRKDFGSKERVKWWRTRARREARVVFITAGCEGDDEAQSENGRKMAVPGILATCAEIALDFFFLFFLFFTRVAVQLGQVV
jgi:hypothetical protein